MEKENTSAHREWSEKYSQQRHIYEAFTSCILKLLQDICDQYDIEFAQIESRTKAIDSFDEKIQRKSYVDPLNEIHDLSGIRAICFFKEDVDALCDVVKREFFVDLENSIDKSPRHDQLGYQSRHLIVSLSNSRCSLMEYSRFRGLKAEIQVRTIGQHAWAAVEHKFNYKGEVDIPENILRRLYRISAVLELCDEEFSRVRQDVWEIRRYLDEKIDKGSLDIEINTESLKAYMRSGAEPYENLTKKLRDRGVRFSQRDKTPDRSFEYAVHLLRRVGLTTVQSLDQVLKEDQDKFIEPMSKIFANVDGLITQPYLLGVFATLHSNPQRVDEIVRMHRLGHALGRPPSETPQPRQRRHRKV